MADDERPLWPSLDVDAQPPNAQPPNAQPLNVRLPNAQPLSAQLQNVQPPSSRPRYARPLHAQPLHAQPPDAQPSSARSSSARSSDGRPSDAQPPDATLVEVTRVEVVSRSTVARTERRRQEPLRGWLSTVAILLAAVLAILAVPRVGPFVQDLGAIEGTPVAAPTSASTSVSPPSAPPSTSPEQEPIYKLEDHPLLAAGVGIPDAPCKLPAFRRDTGSLRAYYTALIGCLDVVWRPTLLDGGMPHRTPPSNLAEHPGQTACGNPDDDGEGGEFTALYCPADETLYLPVDRLKSVDRGGPSSHLAVVAHEYGHHVQELSGLLGAAADERDKAGEDTSAGHEVTRRIELQANCFAGLFLAAVAAHGSISRSLASQAVADFRNGGLPDTHGSRQHQAVWATRGYQQRTTAACNTWAAPDSDVT